MNYVYYLKVLNTWMKTTEKAYGYMKSIPRIKIPIKYKKKAEEEIAEKSVDNSAIEKLFNIKIKFD